MQPNLIREHVYKMPSVLSERLEETERQAQEFLPDEILERTEHIIVTGCGYSYIAALYAKQALETLGGVFAEAPYSIDASRHLNLSLYPRKHTLFFGISNSGIVARIAEGLERMQQYGFTTVAVTSDAGSRCARYGDYLICMDTPELNGLPLGSFATTELFFLSLAWRIAELKKRRLSKDRKSCMQKFLQLEERLERELPRIEEETNRFARRAADDFLFEFVASGAAYSLALLGRQLMVGQTGKAALECSTEDWLHSTFFMNRPEEIATVLLKSHLASSLSRENEVEKAMRYLRRPLCTITDQNDDTGENNRILLPESGDVLLNPFSWLVPLSLLAGKVCELTGEYYSRGFRDRWDFSRGGYATEYSEIKIIE